MEIRIIIKNTIKKCYFNVLLPIINVDILRTMNLVCFKVSYYEHCDHIYDVFFECLFNVAYISYSCPSPTTETLYFELYFTCLSPAFF